MCCLSILIQVVLNGFCLGRGLNIATNSIVPRYKDIDKLMNVQFTTSPGVLNVMSNKQYGADLVQCDAILLSPPPIPKVRTTEMFCISGLLFHYLSASSSTTCRGSYVWNISAVYIYIHIFKCGSLPGVIKFGINGLHRLTA